MELTREYFDSGLANLWEKVATKDDLAMMATKDDLALMATKADLAAMATKDDLTTSIVNLQKKMATKDDLISLEQRLTGYIEEVGQNIVEAVAFNFDKVEQRIDKLEIAIKPINNNAYVVKDEPAPDRSERLPKLHDLMVAGMAKRGRKWPSHPSGQKSPFSVQS